MSPDPQRPTEPARREPTILIIDDDPRNLAIVAEYLEEYHYTILVAEDGQSGLARADLVRPDLILLDIMMPGLDGYETCRRLQSSERTGDIPIIFMTALAETEHKVRGFAAGCVDYITKPFQREEVLARVGVHLRLRELTARLQESNLSLEKRVEERTAELRNSERRLADIINMLPDATFAVDLEGKIILWNRTAEEFTGVKAAEMVGKGNHEYALPFYRQRRPVLIDLALNPSLAIDHLYPVVKRAGEMVMGESYTDSAQGKRYLSGIAVPLYDSAGQACGAIESIRDITDRKRAEDEQLRLVTAIEQSADAILITGTDWLISYANPACERITGYSRGELIGRPGRIVRSDHNPAMVCQEIEETLARGETWTGRLINRNKNGSLYETEVTNSPVFDKQGTIINFVSIQRDITNEVKLEKALRQALKMEAIGTLAGGIAHDFNNILTAINGFAEMALTKVEKDGGPFHDLKQILVAGGRAASLVRQILTFSRQSDLPRQPVRMATLVEEVLKLLRSSLPATIEIRCSIDIGPDEGVVLADATQLHQVLMNLAANSAYAMRQDMTGILSVSLAMVGIDGSLASRYPDLTRGSYVRLSVGDTGHGMDAAVVERIFDPYFTTKAIGEGTGMGLAVVQGIVRSHGGAITVYSEPGKGTSFHVFLPAIAEKIEPKSETPGIVATGTEHVLFVDDESALTLLGTEMFESLGYRVTAKTDSRAALECFRAAPSSFDLVMTDMTMPGLTGKELAGELMKIRPDTPIILCTGFNERIDEAMAKGLGIREFLLKPYGIKALAMATRKALAGSG